MNQSASLLLFRFGAGNELFNGLFMASAADHHGELDQVNTLAQLPLSSASS